MKTTENAVTQDPLGLKRFALTESAYDLVSSLIGIYARLRYKERRNDEPDLTRIALWQENVDRLYGIRSNGKWADLFFLEQLIEELAREYKQAARQEEQVNSQSA